MAIPIVGYLFIPFDYYLIIIPYLFFLRLVLYHCFSKYFYYLRFYL